ncbi:hypothetical protein T01_10478 [Trichinella spiralis]|uniref:Uncharacterized protein n=1 Tax=Trichinella spiralis TaxID=6334 RepID=A0A0V1B946_TRISP|nr:hypothetical protein T01_10478 [Trichinella spiralis]
MTKISKLLRYPMKLVPLATLVHMDVKAFPSRPSVPLLITNSILEDASAYFQRVTVEMLVSQKTSVIRNHADKYVITKHCHQLMPLGLATFSVNSVKYKSKSKKTRKQTMVLVQFSSFRDSVKGNITKVSQGRKKYASGQYANFYCPQAKPGAMPQAIF